MPRTRASAPVLRPNPPSSRGNACSRAAAEASAARATGASRSSSASRRHAGPRGGAGARSRAIEAAARGRKRAGGRQRRRVLGGEKKTSRSESRPGFIRPLEWTPEWASRKKPSRRASRGSEETERGRDAPGDARWVGWRRAVGVWEPRDALAGAWARRGRWTHPRGRTCLSPRRTTRGARRCPPRRPRQTARRDSDSPLSAAPARPGSAPHRARRGARRARGARHAPSARAGTARPPRGLDEGSA